MTTAGEGSTPTALDLLFGPDTDAAETLAGEILSPGGDQNLGRALAHLPEMTRKAAVQEAATTAASPAEGRPDRRARARVARAPGHRRRRTADAGRTSQHRTGQHGHARGHGGAAALRQRPGGRSEGGHPRARPVHRVRRQRPAARDQRRPVIAVRSGRCEITGTLAVQGTDLLVRRAHLELPGVVSLRRGIRLLPVGEYPPGDYPPDGPARAPGTR